MVAASFVRESEARSTAKPKKLLLQRYSAQPGPLNIGNSKARGIDINGYEDGYVLRYINFEKMFY